MSGKNIIEKIWDAHLVEQLEGRPAILGVDLILLHEVTSAQAFKTLEERELQVFDRGRCAASIDHSIPTRKNRFEIYDEEARVQLEMLRSNCARFEIPFFDFGSGHQGVVHVIGPELGFTQPGLTVVCGDSHTSTHGAFGALAFGIGTSEVGHVLASGCLLQKKPRTMKVEFRGGFRRGVFAKDAIMKLIAQIGIGGGTGHVIEYCGSAIGEMSLEARMTICNMSIECGARAGLIAPDEKTFSYLKGRPFAPTDRWDDAVNHWRSFVSDPDARYDREQVVELSNLAPMVTWGTNPGQAVSLEERIPELDSFCRPKLSRQAAGLQSVHSCRNR